MTRKKEMIEKELQNGQVVEAYPLTQAQSLMYWIFNTYGKNPAVLNIGTGQYWKDDFREDLLRQAIEEAVERCDTMRLRFSPDQQYGLVQYLADKAEIEIEDCDMSDISYEESYKIIKEWSKIPTDFIEKPLHVIKIMHLADGLNGLYVRFQHLAFDGYSSKMFISDVMAIYLHKKCGFPYPKPMRSYIEAVKGELAYLNSDREKEDTKYWMERYSKETEPIYNDYLLDNRLFKARKETGNPDLRYVEMFEGEHPESRTFYNELSAEQTNKIAEVCKKTGMTIPCVLMLGLRTALSAFNENQEDVSFKFMINRRSNLVAKTSGGIRMLFFTLRSIISPDTTFEQAAGILDDEEQEIFHHCDFHTLKMYHIKHTAMKMKSLSQTYDTLSFSYHSPVDTPAENDEIRATVKGEWYNNDYSCQNLYLTVKHRPSDNGLEFIFEYRIFEDSLEDLKVLYEKMIKAIEMGIDNPQITIGEILEEIKLDK
ncbi:MAG: condensation domain-containing protein [Clostridia bacterium]|nr:condensation domain-containing protein [Clostridia bacterium]